jgi:hypothetical protein
MRGVTSRKKKKYAGEIAENLTDSGNVNIRPLLLTQTGAAPSWVRK